MIPDSLKTKIKQDYVLKDKWVKELIYKSSDPEELAQTIEKRIKCPGTNGPYITNSQDEYCTDIISAYIEELPELHRKVEISVGLLLYKLNYNEINQSQSRDLLEGVFTLIDESNLKECHILLFKWLKDKSDLLKSDDRLWRLTYRMGMMAFAKIQPKNPEVESYWRNIWESDHSYFWGGAFRGLHRANPEYASKQLPLLISRDIDSTKYTLVGMWKDSGSRDHLERAIKNGLASEQNMFAGIALNMLLGKLTDEHKDDLMLAIKE